MLLIAGMATSAFCATIDFEDPAPEPGHDDTGGGVRPRSISFSPVTGNLTDDLKIDLHFAMAVGNTQIEIKDANGIVYYKTTVNSSQTNSLTIDVSALLSGEYTITVKNTTEEVEKCGKFVIN